MIDLRKVPGAPERPDWRAMLATLHGVAGAIQAPAEACDLAAWNAGGPQAQASGAAEIQILLAALHQAVARLQKETAAAAPDKHGAKRPGAREPRKGAPKPEAAKAHAKKSPDRPRLVTHGGSGPTLRRSAKGTPVAKLQRRLARFGFDPGPIDGDFGPRTERAVRRFQKHHDLAVDGIVGPRTWNRLGIDVKGKVVYPDRPAGRNSDKRVDIGGPQPAVVRNGKYIGAGIARAFDRMVGAARRDGVNLVVNSGYRTHAEQQALWNANPDPRLVARPGTSNHEKGNAIDFANTPGAWAWLKAHATRHGFHNYPPEPWHYSTNGR